MTPPPRELLVGRYRMPQPRTALAKAVRHHAQCGDGRLGRPGRRSGKTLRGLRRVRRYRSGKHSVVRAAANLLARGIVGIEAIVSGGDDYEILCAIPPSGLDGFKHAAQTAEVSVAVIGKIVAGASSPRFLDGQGGAIALPRLSYSHF